MTGLMCINNFTRLVFSGIKTSTRDMTTPATVCDYKYTNGHHKCNTKKNKIYFVDSMLTKYQMIKFIDFCEVRFLTESVARVAAMLEITAATHLGIDSKRVWMCYWGAADQAASTRCQS
ncbi:hypothetical protein TNCV_4936021 [Trichonephila clavipes]|nr:hypothetical protein TNCV_4936021 [Trichonephila clavipes]